MAATVLADSGFLTALLRWRDRHRDWAAAQAERFAPPWHTCEAALAETFHLLGQPGFSTLCALIQRRSLVPSFALAAEQDQVLALMHKYSDVPMSLADACLVRMSEIMPDPIVLTTDADFRVYRRHSRQVVPCALP